MGTVEEHIDEVLEAYDRYSGFLASVVRQLSPAGVEVFVAWFEREAAAQGEDPELVAEVIADLRRTIEEEARA